MYSEAVAAQNKMEHLNVALGFPGMFDWKKSLHL